MELPHFDKLLYMNSLKQIRINQLRQNQIDMKQKECSFKPILESSSNKFNEKVKVPTKLYA
jgi:hypothetical protein